MPSTFSRNRLAAVWVGCHVVPKPLTYASSPCIRSCRYLRRYRHISSPSDHIGDLWHRRSGTKLHAKPPYERKRRKDNHGETKEAHLTPPLLIETTEILAKDEVAPAPLWGSFCGAMQGMWVGTVGAFQPSTGAPEPIALAEDNKTKLYSMSQCVVEERVALNGKDTMQRHVARAKDPVVLRKEMAAAGKLQFDCTESMDWDQDALSQHQLGEGLFVFDGGSYSAGPFSLVEDEPASVDEPGKRGESGSQDPSSGIDLGGMDSSTIAMGIQGDAYDEESASQEDTGEYKTSEVMLDEEDPSLLWDLGNSMQPAASRNSVNIIEACLQASGERRIRVQLTLQGSVLDKMYEDSEAQHSDASARGAVLQDDDSSGPGDAIDSVQNGQANNGYEEENGGYKVDRSKAHGIEDPEVDVDLLRIAVHSEEWEGMPGRFVETDQPEEARTRQEASSSQRLRPRDLAGFWNCFEVEACTIEDLDMRTGKPARLPLYVTMVSYDHRSL